METWGTGEKNDISTVRFKSYYVVWKLEIKKKIAYMETEFKSYYVVWKRKKEKYKKYQIYGLNRTMQYGNEDSSGLSQ